MQALPADFRERMVLLKRIVIVCGHYGCGKTNLALNLAVDAAGEGEQVTLIDMDLVNPYFRSSEYGDLLEEKGVRLIKPVDANSTLDLPAVSPAVHSAVSGDGEGLVILDVGGDDAGAIALGQYARLISENPRPYEMYYVVNRYRPLSADTRETTELLEEIQAGAFPIIRDFSRENNKKKRVPADPGWRNHLVSVFLCPVVELHGEKGRICVAFPKKGWYNLPVFLEVVP